MSPEEQVNFRTQLEGLLLAGWRFCTVSEGVSKLMHGEPGKSLTVTFDDGDKTVLNVTAPVLRGLGVPACLYVTTDYVLKGSTYRGEQPLPAVTWKDLAAWCAAGHEVGSHTHTHAPINRCHPRRIQEELVLSQRLLEEHLGVRVRHFSYPWGQYDSATHTIARSLSLYETFASIDRGFTRDSGPPLLLKRDLIDPQWPLARVKAMLLWGLTPLYNLQRRFRKPRGYWDLHPEETWGPLTDTQPHQAASQSVLTRRGPAGV